METANLRVGKQKNMNLNYSAADVAWNHTDGKQPTLLLENTALMSVCLSVCQTSAVTVTVFVLVLRCLLFSLSVEWYNAFR